MGTSINPNFMASQRNGSAAGFEPVCSRSTRDGAANRPRSVRCAERSLKTGATAIWGMGLPGVVVCFASRIADGFDSHMLHFIGVQRSLVARFAWDEEVRCSNHLTPTLYPYSSVEQSNGLLNRRSLVRIQLRVPYESVAQLAVARNF